MLWTPCIDYVHGWREATDSAAALLDALIAVGIDTTTITARADASADGAGLVRLALPTTTACQLTTLAKVAAVRLRRTS
jgi:hypothetical protein